MRVLTAGQSQPSPSSPRVPTTSRTFPAATSSLTARTSPALPTPCPVTESIQPSSVAGSARPVLRRSRSILAQRTNRPYEVAASAQSALEGTDLVIIGTEWREYQDLDPAQAAGLARNRYVIDGRNCLDAQAWKAAGWSYRGIGRR